MLFLSVSFWWGTFAWYRGAASVSIADFLPTFFYLCVNFLMMAAALPDDVPDQGLDLRKFYLSSRVHRWALLSVSIVTSIALEIAHNWPVHILPFMTGMWPVFISAAFAIACLRSPRIWIHILAITWIGSAIIYGNLLVGLANS
jgi:hypothetical protein